MPGIRRGVRCLSRHLACHGPGGRCGSICARTADFSRRGQRQQCALRVLGTRAARAGHRYLP
jgi:hypothetical protein